MVRTTKSQRHKNKILEVLEQLPNLSEDKFGNFVNKISNVRYHPKKTALNYQTKRTKWVNIWTAYYKDIEITEEGKIKVLKTI